MTAGSNPQWRFVCMYCWDGTINYLTVKSGVFLYTLDNLLEDCHVKSSFFTQIVAQGMSRTQEQLLLPPERRDLLLQLLTGVYRVELIV